MERDNVVYYVVYSEKEREMRRGIDKEERAYIECRCDAGTRGEKGDGGGGRGGERGQTSCYWMTGDSRALYNVRLI